MLESSSPSSLLALVGAVCLMAGVFERRMAIAQEDMAVLDFADPEADYAALERTRRTTRWVAERAAARKFAAAGRCSSTGRGTMRISSRWRARPASPRTSRRSIPEMQVLAANALYRVAQRGPQDRATLLKNLDAAIRAYDEALRAGAERPDVAFNYELAVRMRDEVGAGKRKALPNVEDRRHRDRSEHARRSRRAAQGHEGGAVPDQDSDGSEAKSSRARNRPPAPARSGDGVRCGRCEWAQGASGAMERLIDFESLRFGEPLYLWLLVAPGAAVRPVVLAGHPPPRRCAQVPRGAARPGRRALCARSASSHSGWRSSPRCRSPSSRSPRPQGITAIVRSPGVDIVLLMDGSTSMRVRDMGTDRWQRAMQWVRTLTKTLSWNGDRMALATFADIAVPQMRLTRDPNTILFFLDHLDDAPTFRLENETSWNTNVEDAIYWGVKLVETDQEMYGPSKNARTFVVVSDGQVWSGNVQRAIAQAVERGIAVDVIGVGTSNGGIIPLPRDDKGVVLAGFEPIRSTIDRTSLREIARAGRRRVFRDRHVGRRADRRARDPERRTALRQPAGRRIARRAVLVSARRCRGLPRAGRAVREAARAARPRPRRRAGAARAHLQPAIVTNARRSFLAGQRFRHVGHHIRHRGDPSYQSPEISRRDLVDGIRRCVVNHEVAAHIDVR